MPEQIFANAFIAAAGYFVFGVAFAAPYRIGKFFDVSPAAGYVMGAYLAHRLLVHGWTGAGAIATAIVVAGGFGAAIAAAQNAPSYRERSAGEKFVATLAIVIVAQSMAALWMGDDTKVFPWPYEVVRLGGVSLTNFQLLLCAYAVVVGLAVEGMFLLTSWGRIYRAVVSDSELAVIQGIPLLAVTRFAGVFSMMLMAGAGILIGADLGVTPMMGFRAVLFGVIAVVIGGGISLGGILVGALVLAVTQHAVYWFLGGRWQDAAVFALLAGFLLWRPQGILGHTALRESG